MNSLKRIIQESIIIAENIQQADKIYFKTGLLSPNVRRHIVHITEGDAWTKLLTDIYYTEMINWKKNSHWAVGAIGDDYKEPESESEYHTPGVDDMMGLEDWKRMRRFHNQLKTYNKNVFPIAGLNANGVKDVWELVRSLNEREKILVELKKLPSIAIRNMKDEIREVRNGSQLKKYRELLEYFTAQYSYLSNRSGRIKANIEKKMFKSGVTLDDLVDFADEKENLIGGKKLDKVAIKKIIKENSYDLNIIYDKGDKMVVEVTGQNGIKKIGCNSVWCFTYGAGVYNNRGDWYSNSTNDCVYVFIDFSEQSDSPYFMYVLVKPIDWNSEYSDEDGDRGNSDCLANMSNEYNDNPIGVITHFMSLEVAKKLLNFGEEPEESEEKDDNYEEDNEDTFEEKPEPEYQDPNKLKLDLQELRRIIRETFLR